MDGNAAVTISRSSFILCYTSGKVSALLGDMVHGAPRVGCHAYTYLWWSLQSLHSPPDKVHGHHLHAQPHIHG